MQVKERSKARAGFNQVRLPGEPEWIAEKKLRKEDISIDDSWWDNIVATAKNLGGDVEKAI